MTFKALKCEALKFDALKFEVEACEREIKTWMGAHLDAARQAAAQLQLELVHADAVVQRHKLTHLKKANFEIRRSHFISGPRVATRRVQAMGQLDSAACTAPPPLRVESGRAR